MGAERLFGAIVLAGFTMACNRAPLPAGASDLGAPDLASPGLAPADLGSPGDLSGCFVCPGVILCPSPCGPTTDLGACWPCFV